MAVVRVETCGHRVSSGSKASGEYRTRVQGKGSGPGGGARRARIMAQSMMGVQHQSARTISRPQTASRLAGDACDYPPPEMIAGPSGPPPSPGLSRYPKLPPLGISSLIRYQREGLSCLHVERFPAAGERIHAETHPVLCGGGLTSIRSLGFQPAHTVRANWFILLRILTTLNLGSGIAALLLPLRLLPFSWVLPPLVLTAPWINASNDGSHAIPPSRDPESSSLHSIPAYGISQIGQGLVAVPDLVGDDAGAREGRRCLRDRSPDRAPRCPALRCVVPDSRAIRRGCTQSSARSGLRPSRSRTRPMAWFKNIIRLLTNTSDPHVGAPQIPQSSHSDGLRATAF